MLFRSYSYANTFPFGLYPADAVPGASAGAVKGFLVSSTLDRPKNASAYANDTFYLRPDLALDLGLQYERAVRARRDRLNAARTGRLTFDSYTPKLGLLWDVDAGTQVFANVSRSAEAPSYDVNANVAASAPLKMQKAKIGRAHV